MHCYETGNPLRKPNDETLAKLYQLTDDAKLKQGIREELARRECLNRLTYLLKKLWEVCLRKDHINNITAEAYMAAYEPRWSFDQLLAEKRRKTLEAMALRVDLNDQSWRSPLFHKMMDEWRKRERERDMAREMQNAQRILDKRVAAIVEQALEERVLTGCNPNCACRNIEKPTLVQIKEN